jgi:stearoyl-CoA desaturase (delta-9 desaturase)
MHHAYADTDKDPHSPKYHPNLFKMMWQTKTMFAKINDNKIEVEERFTKNLPDWRSLDNWGQSFTNRIMWGIIYVGIYMLLGAEWWMYGLVPIQILSSPIHGTIINWFAHKYGTVNFELSNTAKNFMPVDFLMMGEDYHNNHHKFPSRANFGVKWYEVDPTYCVMLVLEKMRIIKIKNKGFVLTEY